MNFDEQILGQADWTEIWDQNEIAADASLLVDKILLKIFESKLELQEKLDLNFFELSLLYRFPIYVGVNIFLVLKKSNPPTHLTLLPTPHTVQTHSSPASDLPDLLHHTNN